jgi:hypothetical protein
VDKNSSSGRLSTKSQNRIISISGMKKLIWIKIPRPQTHGEISSVCLGATCLN